MEKTKVKKHQKRKAPKSRVVNYGAKEENNNKRKGGRDMSNFQDQEMSDNLKAIFESLSEFVSRLETLDGKGGKQVSDYPRHMNHCQAVEYINEIHNIKMSPQTLYQKVSKGDIPVIKKTGMKQSIYSREEIDDWAKSGRHSTKDDTPEAHLQRIGEDIKNDTTNLKKKAI